MCVRERKRERERERERERDRERKKMLWKLRYSVWDLFITQQALPKKFKDKHVSMTKKCMLYTDTAHLNSDIHEMSYLYLFYIYTGK